MNVRNYDAAMHRYAARLCFLFAALIFLAASVWPLCLRAQQYRYWRTADGRRSSVRLTVVGRSETSVTLQREDNARQLAVPIDRLSDEDRRFLQSQGSPEADVEPAPVQSIKNAPEAQVALADAPNRPAWPRFRGPHGNGICAEQLVPLDEPQRLWATAVGSGNAALLIDSGKLYTVGYQPSQSSSVLSCLDADTGEVQWDKKIHSGGCDATPVIDDGRIYVLHHLEKPVIGCYQLADGKEVWKTELPAPRGNRHYGHAGSPLVWRDRVIVNAGAGVAVKRDSGEIIWKHEGLPGLATPVFYNHKERDCVLIFGGDTLYGRDMRTGRELWNVEWKTDLAVNACDPIFHDGKVFVSTSYGLHAALFDISGAEPRKLWKEKGSSFSTGFVHAGHVYCFTGANFSCIELKSGERKWTGPGVGGGSAILAGDKIVLLNDSGRMFIADISAERFDASVDAQIHGGTTWTPPSLVGGKLYCRNKDGLVGCVRIGK